MCAREGNRVNFLTISRCSARCCVSRCVGVNRRRAQQRRQRQCAFWEPHANAFQKRAAFAFAWADSAAGVECSEGHFHCDSCVARHAETFLDFDNLGQRKEREGHLKCSNFPLECNSGFADRDLAKHLPIDVFKTYLEARNNQGANAGAAGGRDARPAGSGAATLGRLGRARA